MNNLIFSLLKIGQYSTGDAMDSVSKLNGILKDCGIAIGVIIVAFGIIKLVLAMANEDAGSKQTASMMMGIGFLFCCVTEVLTVLGMDESIEGKSVNSVAGKILEVLGTLISWGGIIFTVVSIMMLILAIANEAAEQKVAGIKNLSIGAGMISASWLCKVLKGKLTSNVSDPTTYIKITITFISKCTGVMGNAICVLGAYYLVHSIREENAKEKEISVRLFITGIALMSFKWVLKKYGLSAFVTAT